jgi:hypothetical protein
VSWVKNFFYYRVQLLSRRGFLFLILNALYFGFVFIGALLFQIPGIAVYELPLVGTVFDINVNPLLLLVEIFLFNLFASGLLVTTLPGLVLFVIPFGVVLWRALLWGTLIAQLPSPQFFVALPTFILEGEAYVIAAVAGVILGLSWLKPTWAYKGENLSRGEAFKKAVRECLGLYVLVAVLLFVAAIVETATIAYA